MNKTSDSVAQMPSSTGHLKKYWPLYLGALVGIIFLSAKSNNGLAGKCLTHEVDNASYETFYNGCKQPIIARVCEKWVWSNSEQCETKRYQPGDLIHISNHATILTETFSSRAKIFACKDTYEPIVTEGMNYKCERQG